MPSSVRQVQNCIPLQITNQVKRKADSPLSKTMPAITVAAWSKPRQLCVYIGDGGLIIQYKKFMFQLALIQRRLSAYLIMFRPPMIEP